MARLSSRELPFRAGLLSLAVASAGLFAACDSGEVAQPSLESPKGPDGTGVVDPKPEGPPPFEPAPGRVRRLLTHQYRNAIQDLLGDKAAAAAAPPPDSSVAGFDAVGAGELAMSESALVAYEASAREISATVRTDLPRWRPLVACDPKDVTAKTCFPAFVRRFGHLAWRRPLSEDEVTRYARIAKAAADAFTDDDSGYEYVIGALLQSPSFLYLVELGEKDPDAKGPARRLTAYETATRLSFFLVDTTPDASLLAQAAGGKLASRDGVRSAARALLEKPAARTALATFYSEFLKLRDLKELNKDKTAFPDYSRALGAAMQEETLLLIEDLVWKRNTDVRELFDANYTFVNADLAKHYGLAPVATPDVFEKRTLGGPGSRAGFLSQGSFLTRFAHFSSTSPTLRGKFVIESVLCGEILPPPSGVITTLPDVDPKVPTTMRQRLEVHRKDPSCSSCHARMDGIGLALESFDGIGAFRTTENGLPIDTVSTSPELGSFSTAAELGKRLRSEPDVARCIVRNLFRNSMGHVETQGETTALQDLDKSFGSAAYRVKDLLIEIVTSPAFLKVGEPR
jgi:hypothetical protein